MSAALHSENRLIAGPERANNVLNASSSSPVWMYQSWAVQLAEDVLAFQAECERLQSIVDSLDPEYVQNLRRNTTASPLRWIDSEKTSALKRPATPTSSKFTATPSTISNPLAPVSRPCSTN